MAKPHWLADVAKVLSADTDDLRQLAKIGGVDPRTAYVGTRLDGADLSGQDLRGMLFTDLDLAKVKHDTDTRIDPDQVLGAEDASDARLVILVLSHAISRDQVARQIASGAALVLGPRDAPLFFTAMARGAIGVVVTFEAELGIMPVIDEVTREASALGYHLILVLQGRSRRGPGGLWRRARPLQQIIFCADPAMARYSDGQGLSNETRHLLRLLVAHGPMVSEQLGPRSIYLRALGRGPDPVMDAAAQIFDRTWRETIYGQRLGYFLLSNSSSAGHDRAEQLLTPKFVVAVQAHRSTTIEAFVDLGDQQSSPPDYMGQALALAATLQPGSRWGPADYRGVDGQPLAIVAAMGLDPGRRFESPGHDRIRRFDFREVHGLVFNPKADLNWVATRLLDVGELWVTARDIIAAGGGQVTTWNLVAAQLRRFVPTGLGAARQAYLELILRAGLPGYTGDRSELRSILDSDIVVRVEDFVTDVGIARFEAVLAPRGAPRDRHDFRLDVGIDGAGVLLVPIERAV